MLTGHVEKRRKSSWTIIINTKPKRITKNIQAKDEKEAKRIMNRMIDEMERGLYQESSNMSLSAYLDKWLKHMENEWEYKTYTRNKGIVDNYLKPALGSTRLCKLKPLQIQEHDDWLQGTENEGPGLAANTIRKHYNLLHAALGQAVKWELIPSNPVDKVDPPSTTKYEAPILPTSKAIVDFQESLKGTMLYLPVMISTTGSLRRGEVCGQRWQDVEWETGRIWVRHSLQRVNGEGLQLKPTKNEKVRSIPLPATVMDLLKHEYMTRYEGDALGLHGEDYVCAWEDGCPIAPDYLTHTFEKKAFRIIVLLAPEND